jgi:hypothetical protein
LGGYTFTPPGKAQAFASRAADPDARSIDVQGPGEVLSHRSPVVPDLWTLTDDYRVNVRDLPGFTDYRPDPAQELYGVGVLVALIGVRKVVPDIFETCSSKEGIGNRVGQNVGVGVAKESTLKWYLHPAEDEFACLVLSGEGMNVDAQAHPEAQFRTP